MPSWQIACLIAYALIVGILSVYGFHRYLMLRLFYRHRRQTQVPAGEFADLPVGPCSCPTTTSSMWRPPST